jgi:hypothetical protein
MTFVFVMLSVFNPLQSQQIDQKFVGVRDLAEFKGVINANKQIVKGQLIFRDLPKSWNSCDFRFTSQYSAIRNLVVLDTDSSLVAVLKCREVNELRVFESVYHTIQAPRVHCPKGVYPPAKITQFAVNGCNYNDYKFRPFIRDPEKTTRIPFEEGCIVSCR